MRTCSGKALQIRVMEGWANRKEEENIQRKHNHITATEKTEVAKNRRLRNSSDGCHHIQPKVPKLYG